MLVAIKRRQKQMDPSVPWNDVGMGQRGRSAQALLAWIPAFAGMTMFLTRHRPFRLLLPLPLLALLIFQRLKASRAPEAIRGEESPTV
jgi:hypothetical protein